jgi:hypothetical protein
MVVSLAVLGPDKDCADEAEQKLITTHPPLVGHGGPNQQTPNCLNIFKKTITGPRLVPDTKID